MDARAYAYYKKHMDELPPLEDYPVFLRRFVANETLAGSGEPFNRLSFVVEGFATVYNTMENGRSVLLKEYYGVQSIGELELLMDYTVYTSNVQAVTRGALLYIPLDAAVRGRMAADAPLLRRLGREVAGKLEHSNRLATQDRLYPVSARLAAYLLYAQKSRRTNLNLTRLSEIMGASYRHLLRTMRDFYNRGWVTRDEAGYRVQDVQALRQLAGEIRYD